MNAPLANSEAGQPMAAAAANAAPSDTAIAEVSPPRRRIFTAQRIFFYLFGGLLINVGVAITLSAYVDPTRGLVTSASLIDMDDRWVVTRYDRPGVTLVISEMETGSVRAWSARQVVGPPNTPVYGDQGSAWASSSTDGQIEWLELKYATAVVPRFVRVYETYNPGALFKVVVYRPADDAAVTAWEGTDPTPVGTSKISVSEVPLKVNFPVQRLRIYLDSPKVPGWNEIDAVGLVDAGGAEQFAVRCKASSVYGQSVSAPPAPPGVPAPPLALLPKYGDLHEQPQDDDSTRVIAGFGWPMVSLWESASAPPTPSGGGATTTITYGSLGSPTASSYSSLASLPPGTSSYIPTSALLSPPASTVLPTRLTVPHRPAWLGLGLNTLVFAPLVAMLHFLLVVPRRFMSEVSRVRRGACIRCGYDLGYDFRGGCPECGWRRGPSA